MDSRHFVLNLLLLLYIFGEWSSASSVTTTNSTTEATESADSDEAKDEKLFGNPFWLGFTVILFICILIFSLVVSLTFGVYKYRKHAKKRGLYRDRNSVDTVHEGSHITDYSMFEADYEPSGQVNATYIGSS